MILDIISMQTLHNVSQASNHVLLDSIILDIIVRLVHQIAYLATAQGTLFSFEKSFKVIVGHVPQDITLIIMDNALLSLLNVLKDIIIIQLLCNV